MPYFFITLFVLLLPIQLLAHSVNGEIIDTQQAITIEFLYSTGDPATYANIQVYSPENTKIEYQNAHTDKFGRFSFSPNTEGTWTIVMSDNIGHKTKKTINIQKNQLHQIKNETSPIVIEATQSTIYNTLWVRSVLGVSLLINIFIGLYIFSKKYQRQKYTHAH